MTTKQLITNIEALSETLTPKQLFKFLDIVDELALMVATEQQQKRSTPKTPITELGQLH
jgi:hypothetical protein